MAYGDSRVTIHMAASLDRFIARKDGSVDWLDTSDTFEGGEEHLLEVKPYRNGMVALRYEWKQPVAEGAQT